MSEDDTSLDDAATGRHREIQWTRICAQVTDGTSCAFELHEVRVRMRQKQKMLKT
jgi:hypothetical protein